MSNTMKWLWPLLALLLSACGGNDDNSNNAGDQPQSSAVVKVMPVSAHAPQLSVMVDVDPSDDNEGQQLQNLSHGQATAFGTLPGVNKLTARHALPEGAGNHNNYELAQAPFEIDVQENRRYEVFLADGEHWVIDMPLAYEEDETQARLTLVHAATTLPTIDVHLTAVGAPIDSSTLLTRLDYKEGDTSIRVDAGDYQIQITEAGSVVYASEALSLEEGMDLSLVAIDNAWIKGGVTGKSPIVISRSGASGSSGLMFDANAGAELRVAHASPNAGLLDVVADNFGARLADNLALGQVTAYQALTSGVHNFKVFPANSSSTEIDINHNLFNGVSWTLFVLEPDSLSPLFISENAREITTHARLRLVHGSSTAGAVNIYITEPDAISNTEPGADLGAENDEGEPLFTPLGTGLTLKSSSNYFPVEVGTYDITYTRAVDEGEALPATPQVVYGPVTVTFDASEVYTLLLRDKADLSVTHDWVGTTPSATP